MTAFLVVVLYLWNAAPRNVCLSPVLMFECWAKNLSFSQTSEILIDLVLFCYCYFYALIVFSVPCLYFFKCLIGCFIALNYFCQLLRGAVMLKYKAIYEIRKYMT